jgi:hypothetical protein
MEEGRACVVLHNMIVEIGKDTLLEGEIDGSGALMTKMQIISRNLDERYTIESMSVASDFNLDKNRHQRHKIALSRT